MMPDLDAAIATYRVRKHRKAPPKPRHRYTAAEREVLGWLIVLKRGRDALIAEGVTVPPVDGGRVLETLRAERTGLAGQAHPGKRGRRHPAADTEEVLS